MLGRTGFIRILITGLVFDASLVTSLILVRFVVFDKHDHLQLSLVLFVDFPVIVEASELNMVVVELLGERQV